MYNTLDSYSICVHIVHVLFFLGKKRFGYNDHASIQSQRQDWLVTVGASIVINLVYY